MALFQSRRIADAISRLSPIECYVFDSYIKSSIQESRLAHNDSRRHFDTQELLVGFMVNPNDSRESQIEKLKEEIEILKQERGQTLKKVVAFSWNPNDEEMPFQTIFWIEKDDLT